MGIEKYQLIGSLGSGAFGTVYLGYQFDLQRQVAVKVLSPRIAGDPAALESFRREAQIMAYLDNPNCVRVFDFFEGAGQAYLVSEYIEGASLRKVIEKAGANLTPQQALGVLKGSLS